MSINGSQSEIKAYHFEVPQGAVLSPTLYNVFTFDIPKNVNTKLALFADDTAVFTSSPFVNIITTNIQNHTDEINEYFIKWKIKLNQQKTQSLFLTKSRKLELPDDTISIFNADVK